MSKTRKMIVIVMLLVFFVGCILFIYPYIRGFYLDHRVQDSASSFLELVKPPEKPAPRRFPLRKPRMIPRRKPSPIRNCGMPCIITTGRSGKIANPV